MPPNSIKCRQSTKKHGRAYSWKCRYSINLGRDLNGTNTYNTGCPSKIRTIFRAHNNLFWGATTTKEPGRRLKKNGISIQPHLRNQTKKSRDVLIFFGTPCIYIFTIDIKRFSFKSNEFQMLCRPWGERTSWGSYSRDNLQSPSISWYSLKYPRCDVCTVYQ